MTTKKTTKAKPKTAKPAAKSKSPAKRKAAIKKATKATKSKAKPAKPAAKKRKPVTAKRKIVKTKKMKGDDRRTALINVAMKIAERVGYQFVTHPEIAKTAKVSRQLVNIYLGGLKSLQKIIIAEAVKTKNVTILTQAVVYRPAGFKLPAGVKPALTKHFATLVK